MSKRKLKLAPPIFYSFSHSSSSYINQAFISSTPIMDFISASTSVIPPIPNFSTNTFITFGDRKAGSVGRRWMFLIPRKGIN
jgi:hypothetical protein